MSSFKEYGTPTLRMNIEWLVLRHQGIEFFSSVAGVRQVLVNARANQELELFRKGA
jgi:hypothetical protein